MARMYGPIWEQLKKKSIVKIKCKKELRARIKKAVIKLKDEDTKFHKETKGGYRLKVDEVVDGLIFELVERPAFIKAEDM